MNQIPFPEVIDNTILATWKSCKHKFFRQYGQHWKPQGESVHLHAGAAFAKGLEAARRAFYEEGQGTEEAIALGIKALLEAYGDFVAPEGSAKTLERMAGALEFYFAAYPLDSDHATPHLLPSGKRAIEFSFAHPLAVSHPQTGSPIIYAGRTDMLADFAGGLYIEDDKTTTSLGASWSNQWHLRGQFTGYCWVAQQYGHHIAGCMIRGVSILKTKYDTQQAITYRPQWMIEEWLADTMYELHSMVEHWKQGYWPKNWAEACTEYGGCAFSRTVCTSPEPETWLPMSFERRVWDPLERKETLLEVVE